MVPSLGTLDWVERQYDWSAISPSVAVLETIARYEETTTPQIAAQIDPPLARAIDTDALDDLIATSTTLSISFTYADYHVHIRGDTVHIARPNPHRLEGLE